MDPKATMDVMHRMMVKQEAALWFTSGRAIHAWRIRKIFRDAKWPIPEEIEQYLDACTERLCEVDLRSHKQVAEAFGLDRKGRNANVSHARLAAAEHVFGLKAINPDRSLDEIFDEVADHLNKQGNRLENGKDARSFVRDAYYSWLKQVRRIQKTS